MEITELIQKFGQRAVDDYAKEEVTALTGQRVDNYLQMLSAFSAQLEDEMGQLEMARATEWPRIRIEATTDKQADQKWLSSTQGLRQIEIKYKLKAVDKIISACKHRLDRLRSEAYNQQ